MSETDLTGTQAAVSTIRSGRTSDLPHPRRGDGHLDLRSPRWTVLELAVVRVERPYVVPFEISGGVTSVLRSLVVRLTATDGAGTVAHGYGETTEMTAYTGETLDGLADVLTGVLAPAVVGHDVRDLAGLHTRMDTAIRGRALAKAALDMALVDAQGRLLGVPAWALVGGRARTHVDLAWVVGMGEPDDVVADAVAHVEAGFRHVKIKGGLDADRDVVLVERLARALRPGTELSLDANGAYPSSSALPVLRAMERAGLTLVEQPVAGWDVEGMARLSAALDIPVMADESLQSVPDAVRLVRERACDVVNIKVLKVGGLHRARQVAAIAEAAGLGVKVGSMPELGLATLAGLHLAATLPGPTVAADLIGPLMVREDLTHDPDLRTLAACGRLEVPDRPGLGAEVGRLFLDADGARSAPSSIGAGGVP